MEIFTNEFKELLSTQLEELTNVVKKDEVKIDGAVVMSDYEIAKFMDTCMNNSDCSKKEKKKKKNQFEVGDVVYYLGCLRGEVVIFDTEFKTIDVQLDNGYLQSFMFNGSLVPNTPIVLSHFPYKLKMKKIKK
jgi:hypothetical protein